MSGSPVLPDLARLDLNPDGSVTLLLTHSTHKRARIDFGAGATEHLYRVTELSAILPIDGEVEALDFRLVTGGSKMFLIRVRTDEALAKLGQIYEHLKQHASTPAPTN